MVMYSNSNNSITNTKENDASSSPYCLICYEGLTHRTLMPCNHNDICPVCVLRLRHLHDDKKCPICKQEHEQVIVDSIVDDDSNHNNNGAHDDARKVFADYPIWGNELGADFIYKEEYGMFVRMDYDQQVLQPLLGYQCGKCNKFDGMDLINNNNTQNGSHDNKNNSNHKQKHKSPLRLLQDHLRVTHRLALCKLCVENKHDFVSRLPRMTPSQIQQHLKHGDGPQAAFRGHPLCVFCRPKRFYDLAQLHDHLRKEHYKCDLCDKQGKPNQFFKDYTSLQRHFDNGHFLCRHPTCLEARFVVFESELDLRHHERQVHGTNLSNSASTKINLQFRYTSSRSSSDNQDASQEVPSNRDFDYDLDGQAFVPEEFVGGASTTETNRVGTTSDGDASTLQQQLHPLHIRRTAELRERAAQVAQQHSLGQTPDFPTLSQARNTSTDMSDMSSAQQQQLRGGWTGGSTVQRVAVAQPRVVSHEAAFPALPMSSASLKKKKPGTLAAKKPPPQVSTGPSSTINTIAAIANSNNNNSARPNRATPSIAAAPPWGSGGETTTVPAAAPKMQTRASAPNLSSTSHFPSLGGGTKARQQQQQQPYAAAHALARVLQQQKQQSKQPSNRNDNSSNFPSLVSRSSSNSSGGGSTGARSKAPPPTQTKPMPSPPPQWDSTAHFPPPPPSQASLANASIRDGLTGDTMGGSIARQTANVLLMPTTATGLSSSSAQSTLEDLKATLGKAKYKELKRLTGEFAQGSLSGSAYIDMSAALFERGYGDDNFWSGVPALVHSSLAPTHQKTLALQYLQSLQRLKHGAMNAEAVVVAQQERHKQQSKPSAAQTVSSMDWGTLSTTNNNGNQKNKAAPTAWSNNKPKARR